MRYLLCAVAVVVCLSIGCSTADAGGFRGDRVQVLRDQFGRRVIVRNGRVVSGQRFASRSRVFRSRNFGRRSVVILNDRRPVAVRDSRFRGRGFGVELFRDSSIFGVRRGFRIGF